MRRCNVKTDLIPSLVICVCSFLVKVIAGLTSCTFLLDLCTKMLRFCQKLYHSFLIIVLTRRLSFKSLLVVGCWSVVLLLFRYFSTLTRYDLAVGGFLL